jgi:hypothetical protein
VAAAILRGGEAAGERPLRDCSDVGHHHHAEDISVRIDHLMAAVFVTGDEERMERLARHVEPDFVYVSPEAVFEGQELGEAFARFRHDDRWNPACAAPARWTSTTGVSASPGSGWSGDVTAMEGCSFGCRRGGGMRRVGALVPGGSDGRS